MAKKKTKGGSRKPRPGDTVYLRGDDMRMRLEKISDDKKKGFCTWTTQKLVEDELVSTPHEEWFSYDSLTLVPLSPLPIGDISLV